MGKKHKKIRNYNVTKRYNFTLYPQQKQKLEEMAKRANKNESSIIRALIDNAGSVKSQITREMKQIMQRYNILRAELNDLEDIRVEIKQKCETKLITQKLEKTKH